MRALKPFFGLIGSLFAVVYFGGLFVYFYRMSGSMGDSEPNGLSPTLIGLAVVTVLLSIPLVFKLTLLVMAFRTPGSARGSSKDDDGFDPDALIARYQSQQSTPVDPVPPPSPRGGPRSFGRKRS